jgi:hypothetical protein
MLPLLLVSAIATAAPPTTEATGVGGGVVPADPWGRPVHLRVALEPPSSWADRTDPTRRQRLFWDEVGGLATVQVWRRGRWRSLSTDAQSGFTTRPLPPGAAIRVRLDGATRWSPVVQAVDLVSPAGLARAASPGPALLAETVGQVAPLAGATGAWVSTLGGGAAQLDGQLTPVHTLTTWEGLPDDRVIAVHAGGDRALLGTARGAALVVNSRVVRVWDESLPDAYVQSVLLDGPRLWVGTFRGLARIEGPTVVPVLAPWSVFSLASAEGGGVWAGYRGLRWVAPDAPAAEPDLAPSGPAWMATDRVFGAVDFGEGVLAAGREGGVRLLTPDGAERAVPSLPTTGGYDVAMGPTGAWAAVGRMGLVGPRGVAWGMSAGLPGDTVFSVSLGDGEGVWVGTDRGAALAWPAEAEAPPGSPPRAVRVAPMSPLPAGALARDLLIGEDGAWVAGPDGVRIVGRPHPQGGDLVVGAGPEVVALVQADGAVWAVGRRAVRLDAFGRLHHVPVPLHVVDAAFAGGTLWAGGPEGLLRYDNEGDRLRLALALPGIQRVRPGIDGPWVISRGAVFQVVSDRARPYLQTGVALDLSAGNESVWVGTTNGLERLRLDAGHVGEVVDVLGEADANTAVPAVAADGEGGCWFATERGGVGRVTAAGEQGEMLLPGPDHARPTRIVPDGPDAAFVLTEAGIWRVGLPAAAHSARAGERQ